MVLSSNPIPYLHWNGAVFRVALERGAVFVGRNLGSRKALPISFATFWKYLSEFESPSGLTKVAQTLFSPDRQDSATSLASLVARTV